MVGSGLVDAIRDASTREMAPFPNPATEAFTKLLDHHMGFSLDSK